MFHLRPVMLVKLTGGASLSEFHPSNTPVRPTQNIRFY